MANHHDILDEQVRINRLRMLSDLTAYRLRHKTMSRADALELIQQTREQVLALFPDKGEVFELVLRPRFLRMLNDRALAEWGIVADSEPLN
jgi:hypothetical protein